MKGSKRTFAGADDRAEPPAHALALGGRGLDLAPELREQRAAGPSTSCTSASAPACRPIIARSSRAPEQPPSSASRRAISSWKRKGLRRWMKSSPRTRISRRASAPGDAPARSCSIAGQPLRAEQQQSRPGGRRQRCS